MTLELNEKYVQIMVRYRQNLSNIVCVGFTVNWSFVICNHNSFGLQLKHTQK